MIGTTISHYRIEAELGRGGMGVVYKALDAKLDRTVAIKVLRSHALSSDDDRTRFYREAKAAAKLNHPNIATVYEIGEAVRSGESEPSPFIAMEFVEGETLLEFIQKGDVATDEAIRIAQEIAEALKAAHAKDLVHRDIKPGNVMLGPDGSVKVLDFGLAKTIDATALTREGAMVGTVAYMSPEQARGDAVDGRSDLWSLGVVLYEMLAGQHPFSGAYDQAVIYQILNTEPVPLSIAGTGVPAALVSVVSKVLAKDCDARYESATAFLDDLVAGPPAAAQHAPIRNPRRAILVAATLVVVAIAYAVYVALPPTDQDTIAILPLRNLGAPEDSTWAGDITVGIAAALDGHSSILVLPEEASQQFAATGRTVLEDAAEAGANYLLLGSVSRESNTAGRNRVRIVPRLIRTSDEVEVWSESYEGDAADEMPLRTQMSERLIEVIALDPGYIEIAPLPAVHPEAYTLYQSSRRYSSYSGTGHDLLREAIAIDSSFVLALTSLSRRLSLTFSNNLLGLDAADEARSLIDRAEDLAGDHPIVLRTKGYFHSLVNNEKRLARDYYLRAGAAGLRSWTVYSGLAGVSTSLQEWEDAVMYRGLLADLNPFGNDTEALGRLYMVLGNFEASAAAFRRNLRFFPDNRYSRLFLSLLYLKLDGDQTRADGQVRRWLELGDPLELLLRSWDFDDSLTLRMFSDLLDNRMTARFPGGTTDSAAFYLAHAEVALRRDRESDVIAYADSAANFMERLVVMRPGEHAFRKRLALAYAMSGRRADARREIGQANRLTRSETPSLFFAQIYMFMGEHDEALNILEYRASEVTFMPFDPLWEPLRGNPRFDALILAPADVN